MLDSVLSKTQREKLEIFLDLLEKWNQHYNLTAIRDRQDVMTHHIYDSLSVLDFVGPGRLLDVGTGPGFPGVPLALARPALPCVLLDSNQKKTRFLTQVKAEIGLDNVTIVNARVEAYQSAPFEQIITRAVGAVPTLIDQTAHLMAPDGQWLFMKGRVPAIELEGLGDTASIKKLSVPGLDAERCLVLVPR